MASSSRKKALVAVALLSAAGGAVAGASTVEAVNENLSPAQAAQTVINPVATPRAGGSSLADMVEAVGPAVVEIEARSGMERASYAGNVPFGLHEFFGVDPRRQAPSSRMGSGFVIDASGLVVTNNHVVGDARTVAVKFNDGRELTGRVLGRDPKTDLAVIRIEEGGRFKAISWGNSDNVRVGESVFAVGSPFGLGNTVTAGIVSARGREIGAGPYDDFLQVDAAINQGNSGGPLFNAAGQVVGVNTAIFSPSGGNVGIGFAIPSQMAQSVVRDIVEDGHVSRGRIGVMLQPLTSDIAEALNLSERSGALIADVEPNGPAAEAGLRRGDVVTAFAGEPIEDSRELARVVAQSESGATVPAEIIRDGRKGRITLRVEEMREG